MRSSIRHVAYIIMYAAILQTQAGAQQGTARTTPPITAAEEARGLRVYPITGLTSDDGRQRVPQAQLEDAIEQRAKGWFASLQNTPVTGMQLDPMGMLAVVAGQETLARQQFAARLATSHLSVAERAYTLLIATTAFGQSARDTSRMRIALEYLAQLDALPDEALVTKFHGHGRIGRAYYMIGDGDAVIRHLTEAIALIPRIPFEQRLWSQSNGAGEYFPVLADVLSGRPGGRAQLDTLSAVLRKAMRASPDLIAKDSVYLWKTLANVELFEGVLRMTEHVGRRAPAITANYWWNTSAPSTPSPVARGATVKTLDDGIIRVMEYGHFGCPGCLESLPKLERLRKRAPANVEMWYVTYGEGTWGVTPCSPDVMAEHLKRYYIERKGYGMPIALFAGEPQPDPDGGRVLGESPSFAAYPIRGYPWFIITDGKGIVRHISLGFSESVLARAVQYLVAEAAHSKS
jgi:hypothetical protein